MSPRDEKSRAVDQLGCRSMVDVTKLSIILEDIHSRHVGVAIGCPSWREFIDRYDTAGTLFYLDPPRWGLENDYGAGVFTCAEFVGLAARLARIAGRFILSGNDVPETRETFRRFAIETVATRYTVSGKWSDVSEGRRHRPASKAAARLARSAVVLAWRLG